MRVFDRFIGKLDQNKTESTSREGKKDTPKSWGIYLRR